MNEWTKLLVLHNQSLASAIADKDKEKILHIYDSVKLLVNFRLVDEGVASEYDKLVDQANDILYS